MKAYYFLVIFRFTIITMFLCLRTAMSKPSVCLSGTGTYLKQNVAQVWGTARVEGGIRRRVHNGQQGAPPRCPRTHCVT